MQSYKHKNTAFKAKSNSFETTTTTSTKDWFQFRWKNNIKIFPLGSNSRMHIYWCDLINNDYIKYTKCAITLTQYVVFCNLSLFSIRPENLHHNIHCLKSYFSFPQVSADWLSAGYWMQFCLWCKTDCELIIYAFQKHVFLLENDIMALSVLLVEKILMCEKLSFKGSSKSVTTGLIFETLAH